MLEELSAVATPWWARQVPRILAVLRFVVPPIVGVVLFFSARETARTVVGFFGG